jgi:hypothetical protein
MSIPEVYIFYAYTQVRYWFALIAVRAIFLVKVGKQQHSKANLTPQFGVNPKVAVLSSVRPINRHAGEFLASFSNPAQERTSNLHKQPSSRLGKLLLILLLRRGAAPGSGFRSIARVDPHSMPCA